MCKGPGSCGAREPLYRLNPEPGRRGLSLGRNMPFILQLWEAFERFQAGNDKTTCVSEGHPGSGVENGLELG